MTPFATPRFIAACHNLGGRGGGADFRRLPDCEVAGGDAGVLLMWGDFACDVCYTCVGGL